LSNTTLANTALSRSAATLAALLELGATLARSAELLRLAWAARSTLADSALTTLATLSDAALSSATLLELRAARALLAKLLRLAWLTLAALTLATLGASAALLSLLELGATLARSAELLRLRVLPTLLAAALLATLLPSRTRSRAAWSLAGRLAALLGLLSAGLAFVLLLAFVLGIFALCNDQAAVSSTGAVQRHAQLWNRNR
jgi:hypothetical protein